MSQEPYIDEKGVRWWTPAEAAAVWGVSVMRVYKWIRGRAGSKGRRPRPRYGDVVRRFSGDRVRMQEGTDYRRIGRSYAIAPNPERPKPLTNPIDRPRGESVGQGQLVNWGTYETMGSDPLDDLRLPKAHGFIDGHRGARVTFRALQDDGSYPEEPPAEPSPPVVDPRFIAPYGGDASLKSPKRVPKAPAPKPAAPKKPKAAKAAPAKASTPAEKLIRRLVEEDELIEKGQWEEVVEQVIARAIAEDLMTPDREWIDKPSEDTLRDLVTSTALSLVAPGAETEESEAEEAEAGPASPYELLVEARGLSDVAQDWIGSMLAVWRARPNNRNGTPEQFAQGLPAWAKAAGMTPREYVRRALLFHTELPEGLSSSEEAEEMALEIADAFAQLSDELVRRQKQLSGLLGWDPWARELSAVGIF